MARYRNYLSQMRGDLFLADAGTETDIIFNRGIDIREFASHTLLPDPEGRQALVDYLQQFIELAHRQDCGLILDAPTWKAHSHWSDDLGEDADFLEQANHEAVKLIVELRDAAPNTQPIVVNGPIGPRGDAYKPDEVIGAADAHAYFKEQIGWLADSDADMVTALTHTQASEATGFCHAARDSDMPAVVSFTVETDGHLPDGQPLSEAIGQVDRDTDAYPAYYMVNCAHPDHFAGELGAGDWRRRIRGIRANASRMSHAELDNAPELDPGDPHEMAGQYAQLRAQMPWHNVFGGCCGSDIRHLTQIADALVAA